VVDKWRLTPPGCQAVVEADRQNQTSLFQWLNLRGRCRSCTSSSLELACMIWAERAESRMLRRTSGGLEVRRSTHAPLAEPGYALSQRVCKRVEQIFGWMKTVGNFRRTRYRGIERIGFAAFLVAAAYNLSRNAELRPTR
jgi:hypothetical protein